MQNQIATKAPVKLYRKPRADTCHCAAYPFPHRAGGGRCTDPGPEPSSCSECVNGVRVRDPYMTGDSWYSITECREVVCPWGRS